MPVEKALPVVKAEKEGAAGREGLLPRSRRRFDKALPLEKVSVELSGAESYVRRRARS